MRQRRWRKMGSAMTRPRIAKTHSTPGDRVWTARMMIIHPIPYPAGIQKVRFQMIDGTLLRLLLRDPLFGARLEHIKRQIAAVGHLVVELPEMEPRLQSLLRTLAKFAELQLTDLIAKPVALDPRSILVFSSLGIGFANRSYLGAIKETLFNYSLSYSPIIASFRISGAQPQPSFVRTSRQDFWFSSWFHAPPISFF
jgi:hypothetical protein